MHNKISPLILHIDQIFYVILPIVFMFIHSYLHHTTLVPQVIYT